MINDSSLRLTFCNFTRKWRGPGRISHQILVESDVRQEGLDPVLELPPSQLIGPRRPRKVNVILVRTEVVLPDQLGHGDFSVDGTTQGQVPVPLDLADVVGWRRGEGDDAESLEFTFQGEQGLPPLVAEMVRLVQDQGLHTRGGKVSE